MGCSAPARPPAPEELAGEWRCDRIGAELKLAPRPGGRLHYATSWNHIALLQPVDAKYAGDETSWNTGGKSQVKLKPRGDELEYTKKDKATDTWAEPCVLRRLSAAEVAARGHYVGLASIWQALGEGHTVLLKGSWLVEQQRAAAVLPRRQELPAGAAWEATELQRAVEAGTVRIVGLSYCWKQPGHPDPQGEQLQTVASLIERRLAYSYPDGTHVLEDVALFWDYASLFQNPRTGPEQEAFNRGLGSVNLWYAHSSAEAWLLTRVPQGVKPYDERGWPVFERAVCSLITPQDSFLDVGLWEGGDNNWSKIAKKCKAEREPPMRPEKAAALLSSKTFTSGGDFERVLKIYERTYRGVLGSTRVLHFTNLRRWGDGEAQTLAECLADCSQLEELDLDFDNIGEAGAAALGAAAAQCARLRVVSLIGNPLGNEGAAALITGLAGCPMLEMLHLRETGIDDRGAEALAGALPRCQALGLLNLQSCRISDAGATALGAVLPQCAALEKLVIVGNPLSAQGKEALKAAWAGAGKLLAACVV